MEKEILELMERIASALERIDKKLDKIILPVKEESVSKKNQLAQSSEKGLHQEDKKGLQELYYHHTPEFYERTQIITDYLRKYGVVSAVCSNEEYNENTEIDNLARIMGEKFVNIKDLLLSIKQSIHDKKPKTINFYYSDPNKIGDNCQVALLLKQYHFLKNYSYSKPCKEIFVQPADSPQARDFLNGKWLERCLRIKIIKNINKRNHAVKFSYMTNIQIEFEGGGKRELDIIFEINGRIYWFEAKTENLNQQVLNSDFNRYDELAQKFHLEKDQVYIVHTNPQSTYILNAVSDYPNMTIVDLGDFDEVFFKNLYA